jgi:hypothetical protein
MKTKTINGIKVLLVRNLPQRNSHPRAEILCVICNQPKSIYWLELNAGRSLAHRSCSQKDRRLRDKDKVERTENDLKSYIADYFLRKLQANTKHRNKKLNISTEMKLTIENIKNLIFSACHYCGCLPNQMYSWYEIKFNGIDRVNNKIGYEADNCVTCCMMCNFAKRDLSYKTFIDWLNTIVEFRKNISV